MNPRQIILEDKLSILRKYQKYVSEDGRPILYQIKSCRGQEVECPFLLQPPRPLANKMQRKLEEISFSQRLFEKIPGRVLPHQTFKMAVAGCPNSCSMPQIKDFGVIAREAVATDPSCECILCRECLKACREGAITLKEDKTVIIHQGRCVRCGLCARVCPTGSIKVEARGYAILLGGKVGRHPRFALELVGLASEAQVLKTLELSAEKVLGEKGRSASGGYEVLVREAVLAEIKLALERSEGAVLSSPPT